MARGRRREDLDTSRQLTISLVWLVGTIGEAATHIPPELRAAHPTVPWRQMVGMRHRLFHGYDQIDLDAVWATVTNDLPPLIADLERILASEESP